MEKKLTTAQIVIIASGAVALIGGFLPWVDYRGGDASAWDSGLFPTYWWVGIFGLLMAVHVLVSTFTDANLPERVVAFSWTQIHLILGFFCVLLTVSFLIVDVGGADKGIGFFLSLLASIGLLVGAFLQLAETARRMMSTGGPTG